MITTRELVMKMMGHKTGVNILHHTGIKHVMIRAILLFDNVQLSTMPVLDDPNAGRIGDVFNIPADELDLPMWEILD